MEFTWYHVCEQVNKILKEKGEAKPRGLCCGWIGIPTFVYKDDVIEIRKSQKTNMFEIFRVRNNNPVIMADEAGMNFRSHGEFTYIRGHFFAL